jgi:hypothetical protein
MYSCSSAKNNTQRSIINVAIYEYSVWERTWLMNALSLYLSHSTYMFDQN